MRFLKAVVLVLLLLLQVRPGFSQPAKSYFLVDSLMFRFEPGRAGSTDSLISFVRHNFIPDSLRVRAYYTWIATHISYDVALFDEFRSRSALAFTEFRPGGQSQDADTVMLQRKAVCEGICNLMNRLCAKSGIASFLVPGITRSPEGEVLENILHTWNAVRTGSTWHLVDITWAAGYMNYHNKYVRRFSGEFFFPSPAQFVRSHWPLDAMWQLLEKPLSKQEFYAGRSPSGFHGTFSYQDSIHDFLSRRSYEQEYIALSHYLRYDPENKVYQESYDHALYNRAATLFNKAGLYFEDYAAYAKKLKGRQIGLTEVRKCLRLLAPPKQFLEEGLLFARNRKFYSEEVRVRFEQMVQNSSKKLVEVNRFIDSYHQMEASLR